MLDSHGRRNADGSWLPYDPKLTGGKTLTGSKIVLSGEYARMQETFRNLGVGLLLGVAADVLPDGRPRSLVDRAADGDARRAGVAGRRAGDVVLHWHGLNVQSLLGIIFVVGIKVANTVLMTDFAQELRRHEGLTPVGGHSQSGRRARRPGDDDRVGRVFRHDSRGIRLEARQRGQRSARAGHLGRTAGRRTGHAIPAARPVCDFGSRQTSTTGGRGSRRSARASQPRANDRTRGQSIAGPSYRIGHR